MLKTDSGQQFIVTGSILPNYRCCVYDYIKDCPPEDVQAISEYIQEVWCLGIWTTPCVVTPVSDVTIMVAT